MEIKLQVKEYVIYEEFLFSDNSEMSSLIIMALIVFVSIVLGIIDYYASIFYKYDYNAGKIAKIPNAPWQWVFFQIWNKSINFIIAGLLIYYVISVRVPLLLTGVNPSLSDFVLLFIISLGLFQLFPYLLTNITQGINAILKRVLDK